LKNKLVLMGLAILLSGCALSEAEINEDLIRYSKTNETKILTGIGEKTRFEILDRQSVIEDCKIQHHGKAFDIDKTASKVLAVYCEGFKPLGIRLRKSSKGQYEVLGYWTL